MSLFSTSRTWQLVAALLFVAGCSRPVPPAYKVGDRAVAISNQSFKSLEENANDGYDSVFPGSVLLVGKIEDNLLLVESGNPGWIDRRHVVPFSQADGFFTKALLKDPDNVFSTLALKFGT